MQQAHMLPLVVATGSQNVIFQIYADDLELCFRKRKPTRKLLYIEKIIKQK